MTKVQQNAILSIAGQLRNGHPTRRAIVPNASFPYILNTGLFLLRYQKEVADVRYATSEVDTSHPERHFDALQQETLLPQEGWSVADLLKTGASCVKLTVPRPDGMPWTSYVEAAPLQQLLTVLGKKTQISLSPDPLKPVYLSSKDGDALLSPIRPDRVVDFAEHP